MKQIQLALELYYDANTNQYPMGAWAAVTTALAPSYISTVPNDPTNSGSYVYAYQSTDGSGNACATAPCAGYVLHASTETNNTVSGVTGTIGGLMCTTGASAPYNYCVTTD